MEHARLQEASILNFLSFPMNKILCKSYHMTVLSIWNGIFFWNANLDSLEIILSLPIQDLYCSYLFTEFKLINQCSIGDYKTFIAVLSLIAFLCAHAGYLHQYNSLNSEPDILKSLYSPLQHSSPLEGLR